MKTLNKHIHEVTEELAGAAEHYAAVNGNPIAITKNVMAMGIHPSAPGEFNIGKAKQLAGMMIAAIALATLKDDSRAD